MSQYPPKQRADELIGLAFSCRRQAIRRWLSNDAEARCLARIELARFAACFPLAGEITDADIDRWVKIANDRPQGGL
jgi:hypothetical protein